MSRRDECGGHEWDYYTNKAGELKRRCVGCGCVDFMADVPGWEKSNAPDQVELSGSPGPEHSDGDSGGEATEASGGDSVLGGEGLTEEEGEEQTLDEAFALAVIGEEDAGS